MKAFIAKVGEILNFQCSKEKPFGDNMLGYVIPQYQREFEWTDEKIITFIKDINAKKKFLGNIILEENNERYEIVDGQQRFTVIILMLVAMYNAYKEEGKPETQDQKNILLYLERKHNWILKNDTIGNYLYKINNNFLKLDIDKEHDIYDQKEQFEHAYQIILEQFEEDRIDLNNFLGLLLDCPCLLLIKDELSFSESIEEMYLDINYKSQLLDEEAIFKGYCFKNIKKPYHDDLKCNWMKLKKCAKVFQKWGYKGVNEYLYHYFLSKPETYEIYKNLKINGRHILENKISNETNNIIIDLINYGNNVIEFYDNVCSGQYDFNDIVKVTNASECMVLKQMCKAIIESNVQYSKFPFFMFIHTIKTDQKLKDELQINDLIKIITNYYIYSFFFGSIPSKRKGKKDIDHSVFEVLCGNEENRGALLVESIKNLRILTQKEYVIQNKYTDDNMYMFYSIIDNYIPRRNFIKKLYSTLNGETKEHLLIHDNKKNNVSWKAGNTIITFPLNDLEGVDAYKKNFFNYLIINDKLNEDMNQFDIVEKIEMMGLYYKDQMPKHVGFVIRMIESLDEYKDLVSLKKAGQTEKDIIIQSYKKFIGKYFGEDNIVYMKSQMKHFLDNVFKN